jgi:hypothetical protein
MNQMGQLINKFLFPGILTLCGFLIILFSAPLAGKQNVLWLFGGLLIFTIGVFTTLLLLDKVKNTLQKSMVFVLIPLAFITAYMAYRSIQEPIEFNREKKVRYLDVVEHLKKIRDIELAYKSQKGSYAGAIDSLKHFLSTDSFTVIKAIGSVPDTLTEEQAVELGLVSRDTLQISVFDSIVKGADLNEFFIIPFSENAEFNLTAGTVERNQVKVNVFEAKASNADMFPDIDLTKFEIAPDAGLSVGSMTEPSTSGNWE